VTQTPDKPLDPLRRFRLIAFDMDDTLYPESDYVRSGYRAVSAHLARVTGQPGSLLLERMWSHFRSGDRRRVFDATIEDLGLQGRFDVPSLVELYRSHVPTISLRPEARQVLAHLRGAGAILAVVTDGPAGQQKCKADALELASYTDAILFTDALPPGSAKPSPEAFARLMLQFHVTADECVYVADNPRKDFLGPRHLGWFTIHYRPADGIYREESAPPGGAADVCVSDLREVPRLCPVRGPVRPPEATLP
jgi:putative hydrolase of the HAD superfamily